MRWAIALLACSAATLAAQAPARDRAASALPPKGSSAVTGRIVAVATGDRLRHAVVRIAGGSVNLPPTLTDEEGRFQFTALPAATFTILITKPGFARTSSSVTVEANQAVTMSDVSMVRGAAISGQLVEETGEPIVASGVLLMRLVTKDDGKVQRIVYGTVNTDDTGAFRFGSLPTDTYMVVPQRLPGGAILVAANDQEIAVGDRVPRGPQVEVHAGEERSGVVLTAPSEMIRLPPLPPSGPASASASEPAQQPITVRGRITRPGGPASRAIVQLLATVPAPPLVTQCDENGRYELVVPGGVEADYRVSVRKPGFDITEYGAQSNRRGQLLHLKPGDTIEDIDVSLKKLSVLSGRILDDLGDPVEGALVRLAQLRWVDGQRKLVDGPGTWSKTDDLGRYRVSGVRAGQYALIAAVGQVVVTEASADFPGYGTSYFPGTTNPSEIQLLSVGASQELTDLDFRLVPQTTFKISGHASDSVGDPVTGGIALSPRRRSGSVAAIQLGAKIDRDGGFEFSNVPPGEYVLQVTRGTNRNSFSEGEFAYRFIDIVDADVTNLDVQTGLGSTINGHVTFDSGEPASLDRMELVAMPSDLDRTPSGQSARARFDDRNRFELARINGPRRFQVNQAPAGWMMKAVIVNGIDVTDEPVPFGRDDQSLEGVEVVLTNRATRLSGHIPEVRDVSPSDLAVLAFSSRREQWYLNTRYIRRTAVSSTGTFAFDGLPPDEYFVFVGYPPDDPGEWRDPDVLERLALQATRARLSEGQKITVDVRPR